MLSSLARPGLRADVSWSAYDPRWYREIGGGGRSDAGIVVLPETALNIASVYRGVNVIAHSIASIPLVIDRRDGEDKIRAREHPSYTLLHDQPNRWMTSFRWRHLLAVQAILWGDHYSQLMPGLGGISQVVPLSPETTRIVDQLRDGRLVYVTRDKTQRGYSEERTLVQDEVFHVRGFSLDGKSGVPLPDMAKNAMGLALAAEKHGSMFLKRGARFNGILTSPTPMKEDVRKENERAWRQQYSGPDASGGVPLLSGGIDFKPTSSNNRESQWLEARNFQVMEVLRYIGVDPVLVGHPTQTQAYSSVEQLFLKFVTHTIQPWTENIAQELNGSVVTGGPEYQARFILEGLLKGDIKTRYEAYRIGIASGFTNRNEVRVREDMNRGPDELDAFLEPLNMVEAGAERDDGGSSARAPNTPPVSNDEAAQAQVANIVAQAALRLVSREVAAIAGTKGKLGAAARFADNPEGWSTWLETFYADHAIRVSEDLDVPIAVAERYCAKQRERFRVLEDDGERQAASSLVELLRLTPTGRIAA